MLKPSNVWKWYFDANAQALMLDLDLDMVFKVSIDKKYLTPDAFFDAPFTVGDASLFEAYADVVGHLPLSKPRRTELVLNAVAANRFHKPLLPKSWFFHVQEGKMASIGGSLLVLQTDFGNEVFLVIENVGAASLCMHTSESPLRLTETKEMWFCETIKVMNNRLSPYQQKYDNGSRHYALVG
ncbi:cell division protein ZapC domain-containing protein [Candidatus Enterovibrio escicola]|nr:cell division protein ZapC domain-containing protein [Candidatus Enterovibrio escacola]